MSFSIVTGQENFSIAAGPTRNTAILSTKRRFDREELDNYFVTVKAQDGAASVLQGFAPGPNTGKHMAIISIFMSSSDQATHIHTLHLYTQIDKCTVTGGGRSEHQTLCLNNCSLLKEARKQHMAAQHNRLLPGYRSDESVQASRTFHSLNHASADHLENPKLSQ